MAGEPPALDPEKAETLLAFASWVRLFFLESISRVEQSLTIVRVAWAAVQFLFSSSFLFFYRFVSRNFYDYFRGIGRRDYDCDCDCDWVWVWVCWWGTESSTECEWGQIVWPESRSGASPFKKARQTSRRGQQAGQKQRQRQFAFSPSFNWTNLTDWPTGPVDDFLHSPKERRCDATRRDATSHT